MRQRAAAREAPSAGDPGHARGETICKPGGSWRREWDLNPRGAAPQHAFQACAIDRSAIPPAGANIHSQPAGPRQPLPAVAPPAGCVAALLPYVSPAPYERGYAHVLLLVRGRAPDRRGGGGGCGAPDGGPGRARDAQPRRDLVQDPRQQPGRLSGPDRERASALAVAADPVSADLAELA